MDKNISEKKHGAIANSARAVWSITPEFSNMDSVDGDEIDKVYHKSSPSKNEVPAGNEPEADREDIPKEIRPWRQKLYDVLVHMNAYAFERLAQRVLRECGFTQVEVTKKSCDGGN